MEKIKLPTNHMVDTHLKIQIDLTLPFSTARNPADITNFFNEIDDAVNPTNTNFWLDIFTY